MKFYSYIFIVFFCVQINYSQTTIYKHFGVDEGLPTSEVYDVYQDKLGYIWFATDKGLSRFNGYEFKNFTTEDGLPDNTILDFYPQENGEVWCYGFQTKRFFYFNEIFDGFKTYQYSETLKQYLESRTILKSVVIDDNGTLYTGGYGLTGLIIIDRNGNLNHLFNHKSNSESLITNIGFHTKTNAFFIINHKYKLENDYFSIKNKNTIDSRLEVVPLNDTQSVFIDKKIGLISNKNILKYFDTKPNPIGLKRINDSLFFAGYYNNGAEIRNVSGEIIKRFLPKKSVSNFLIDAEGSYWFSTIDDGVFYVKNPNINILTEDHISSLVKTNDNILYAGYHNGDITKLQKNKFKLLYNGLNTSNAMVELNAFTNEVYSYSDRKLKNFTSKKQYIIGIRKLPENIEDGVIANFDLAFNNIVNDSIVITKVGKKIQDACKYNEDVLLGTFFGLYVFRNNETIKNQPVEILSHRIDDIDVNKKTNTAFMATQGSGVVVYGDTIFNISKKNGLTNDIVSEVHIENDSTIWVCTNTGLNRILFTPDNTYSITNITKDDGLLSNDIDDVEIINDTVFVATKKGLCYFNKQVIEEKANSKILSLSLDKVAVNNQKIDDKDIKLKYTENNIEFKLQAVSQKNTKNINYYYRLKEIDTTWTITKNRTISFSSLSPGNYTFEAKASIFNTTNNLYTFFKFKILPPFWQSWWFYTLCILAFSFLMYLFFRFRVFTYNQDVIRELFRLLIKRLKRKEQFYKFRANGEDFKIPTSKIQYVNSQGNYLDIFTDKKKYTMRCKIGDFINTTPDALEYLRVHRSYIVRIDKINSKGKNWVIINDQKIPVGETYLSELNKIQF